MGPVSEIGKILVIIGAVIALAGLILIFGNKIGLGKLPGDIFINKGNFSFYFPVVTSIVVSIILTILFNIFFRK